MLPPQLSPTDSEGGPSWVLDTVAGLDAQLADQELWQSGVCEPDCEAEPLEYRTLFDSKGFIFNTGQSACPETDRLQVSRPTTLDISPSKEQLATLINPSSPGHRQLAAVIRVPPQPPLSIALLRCIEVDGKDELAAPRGRFLRAATNLHTRLLDLDSETSQLLYEGFLLKHGFEELLTQTDYLLNQARQLQQDFQDVLYLNDLICLLKGSLDRVSRRRWPFLANHIDVCGDVNLIV